MQKEAAARTAGEAAAGSGITGTQAATSAADALGGMQKPPGFFRSVKDMFDGGGNFVDAAKDAFFPSSITPDEIVRRQLERREAWITETWY